MPPWLLDNLQPFVALLTGVLVASIASRSNLLKDAKEARRQRIKSANEHAERLHVADLERAGKFHEDIIERERQTQGKLDNAIETMRIQGEKIIRLELTLSGFAADVAEEMEDIHAQLERAKINGDLIRQVLGMAKKARETSAHWGPAGSTETRRVNP